MASTSRVHSPRTNRRSPTPPGRWSWSRPSRTAERRTARWCRAPSAAATSPGPRWSSPWSGSTHYAFRRGRPRSSRCVRSGRDPGKRSPRPRSRPAAATGHRAPRPARSHPPGPRRRRTPHQSLPATAAQAISSSTRTWVPSFRLADLRGNLRPNSFTLPEGHNLHRPSRGRRE